MEGSGKASQSGAEGDRAMVGSETLGDVTVTEEREDIVKARKISASVAGTSRMRSRNYNDRRRQSSTLLGKHQAVAAFGLWLISLLALRFITCLDSLRLHKAGSRGVFPGLTSRKLAEGQDDRLPLVSAGDSDSEDGQPETPPAGWSRRAGASGSSRCNIIMDMVLTGYDATSEEPAPSTTPQGDETPAGEAQADESLDDDVFLPPEDDEPATSSQGDETPAGEAQADEALENDEVFLSEYDETTIAATASETDETVAGSTEADSSSEDDVFLADIDTISSEPPPPAATTQDDEMPAGSAHADDLLTDDDDGLFFAERRDLTIPATPSQEDEMSAGSTQGDESLEFHELRSSDEDLPDAPTLTPTPTEVSEMDPESASVRQAEVDVAPDEATPLAAPRTEDEMSTDPTEAHYPGRDLSLQPRGAGWLSRLTDPAILAEAVLIFVTALFTVLLAPQINGPYEALLARLATPASLLLGSASAVLIAILLARRAE